MKQNSIKGRICVYKNNRRKYINPELLPQYLDDGYHKFCRVKEKTIIEELAESISYNELFDYYEIQNHTKKDTLIHFNLTLGHLNGLLDYYGIKKSTSNRAQNSKKGKLLKYGDENYNNREKAVKTCLEKYNVENPFQMESTRLKTESHEVRMRCQQTYLQKTGKKVWNEGGSGLQKWVEGQAEKRHNTMVEHNSFNTSKPEEELYKQLCNKYGVRNVKRNYNEDPRYPWHCDFYVVSEDLFIELNKFPTHYTEPFDENNPDHIKLLEHCKTSPNNWIESEMVNIWAGTDVIKYNTAIKNNLNYRIIY